MKTDLGSSRIKKADISLFILLTLIYLPNQSRAAFEPKQVGSSYIGSGSTGLASELQWFATLENPAKLAGLHTYGIDFYIQDYYGLKSLSLKALECRIPLPLIPLGVGITQFGNKTYQEVQYVVGSGVQKSGFRTGFSLHFYQLNISGYGEGAALGINISGLYQASNEIRLAYRLENINRAVIGKCEEQLPAVFELGMEYKAASGVFVNLEISKVKRDPFNYKFGVIYALHGNNRIMGGYNLNSESVSAGISVSASNFHFDYAFDYHMILGLTNSMSIGYEI